MYGYFCIGVINFMLKVKGSVEYTNLFSPDEYKMNDKMILKYFQEILKRSRWKKSIGLFKYKKFKNLKILFTVTLTMKIKNI